MIKNIALYLSLILFNTAISHTLSAEINEASVTTSKEILVLEQLCDNVSTSNYNDSKTLLEISSRLLAPKYSTNLKFKANGTYALAESHYYNQNFKKSLEVYEASLIHFQELKDTFSIAKNLNSIGVVNYILGDNEKAIKAYLLGFDYFKAIEKLFGMAQMYHNIAIIYGKSENYEKSDYYTLKGFQLYKEIGERELLADLCNNYAISLVKRLRFSEGLNFYRQATSIYEEIKNKRGSTTVIFNIGRLFELQKQMDSAYIYFKRAHSYFEESGDTINLINSFFELGNCYMYKKEYDSAFLFFLKSNELNKKIGDKEIAMDVNEKIAICYESLGDYQNALYYSKLYQQQSDSLNQVQIQTKIAEIESAFQVKQTQKELALSRQSNRSQSILILFIIIGTIVSFVAIYFYLRIYRFEQEKRSLLLEHKVLRTQMDPHFIFNSMSALQCYIMDDNPDEAIRFLYDFSALLRLVLQYSKDELIPITKEKKILEYYLSLQNKRFDNKIAFDITIDKELLQLNAMIPPMLAQPFIENSLEHGGLSKFDDAKILVSFKKVGNRINLTINDNGIGIDASQQHHKETSHKSMAISITYERLALLNSNQKEKVDFIIHDLSHEGGRGTKVEFSIPLNT